MQVLELYGDLAAERQASAGEKPKECLAAIVIHMYVGMYTRVSVYMYVRKHLYLAVSMQVTIVMPPCVEK